MYLHKTPIPAYTLALTPNPANQSNPEHHQEALRDGAASQQLQAQYHLHHLDSLANSHPGLMPAQTPQLLLQIGHHQQEENPQGKEFRLYLCIACQM